ncbi:hypothetical protein [Streptomyces atroolivaceus]|uniref:hypothetical protein n=1 Tax=Streptomyces atroolivaceus TaxID=66869 RepID=UPI0037A49B5A
MSAALPFLIRLAVAPAIGIAVRPGLVDLLIVAAELSQPVDAGTERRGLLLGYDRDHPEREWCRAAFTAHASALRALPDDRNFRTG